jgi:hypothetical protein
MPEILATPEERSGGLWLESSLANSLRDPIWKIPNTKQGSSGRIAL